MTTREGTNPRGSTILASPPQSEAIRRADVSLRARYPQLQTRIFEITRFIYRIVFDKTALDADRIRDEFEKSIQPVTLQINLSNDVPAQYLREIIPIADHEISKGFAGLPLNRDDIRSILSAKFPDLPELLGIGAYEEPAQRLTFSQQLTAEQEVAVRDFFERWESGWQVRFEIDERLPDQRQDNRLSVPGDILRILPAKLRAMPLRFVEEDESFWFDHVDTIFEGGLRPECILDFEDVGAACYFDASTFAQIDLRQALISYDTIFISPPLVDSTPPFWEDQLISKDDVLKLAHAGRLKLVLRQPEERTDPDFLAEVYKVKPDAIIGRRKAAALLASDLVQTANEFLFSRADIAPHVPELARTLASTLKATEAEIVQLLSWPNGARRACLLPLMSTGLMSLGSFGPGKLMGEQLQRISGRGLQLEALVAADGVHIAHILNATFIPPTNGLANDWLGLRRVIGDRLNFYRAFNTRISAVWAASERQREEKIRVLPPIPLFEFGRHVNVSDLIQITCRESDRRKGRGLISRLSELPPEARQAEIDSLTLDLYNHGLRKERRQFVFDTFDNAKEVGLAIADVTLFPLRSAWGLVKATMTAGRRIKVIDRFMDDLERDLNLPRNEDIHFLSKIERVAELREP